ncbi:MAG TPA: neutral/alkaline non-lysosomal ceramidase N-terminal domain-containing protein [Nitrospiria bacterium]|nr:neutral/alkaline non-lysosomal ceramidase N-terminal domain-containing protein [Nitrospiria bacterium]
MITGRAQHICCFVLAVIALSLTGCLSIDYTPIDRQPFFHRTAHTLDALPRTPPAEHARGPFRIGTAKIEITPPVGLPLAAYGARISTGVHDPIMARALAMSDDRETVVLVSVDLLAVTDDFFYSISQKVRAEIPIPEDHLLISATHTHSGPGNLGKRFWESLAAGPYNDGIFEMTTSRVARAAVQAYRRLRPASVSYGRVDAGDRIMNRMIKGGPTDPELSFLVFKSPEGRTLAYLVNFSAHPTLLRSTNRLLSGDFPAVVSRVLEERVKPDDPDLVALYTSGAVADQRPRPPDGHNVFERAERMGRDLAERIQRAGGREPAQDRVEISSRMIRMELPPPQIKLNASRRLPVWMGRALLSDTALIQVVQIGPTLLFGVPCDLGSEIGITLKQYARTKGFEAMVVGFSDSYVGYVISDKYYASPAYEAFMSFNGPYMEDYLTYILEKMTDGLDPPHRVRDR